jgi:hypothetical protein
MFIMIVDEMMVLFGFLHYTVLKFSSFSCTNIMTRKSMCMGQVMREVTKKKTTTMTDSLLVACETSDASVCHPPKLTVPLI